MGTAGTYHEHSSLWKGMAIPNGTGEPRQRTGERRDDSAPARGTVTLDVPWKLSKSKVYWSTQGPRGLSFEMICWRLN